MGDSLSVEVVQASEELLEGAFDLCSVHTPFADGSVQISTRTELHDFAPGMVLILQKIDRLDDIRVMEGRRNAILRGKFLDVVLFALVLPALPELLENKGSVGQPRRTGRWVGQMGWQHLNGIDFPLSSVPLVRETNDASSTLSDRKLATDTIFF